MLNISTKTAKSETRIVETLLSGQSKDIPLFKVFMPETVLEPLSKVLFSGYIGEGPVVKEFEQQLGKRFDNKNVLALNNGTAAIQLALRLSNVGYGDEVISTPMTCTATNEPVLALGAKIIWADIDSWTGNIDPADVAKKITPKTKAIICVHWGGYPCDLEELNGIAAEHGINLIEDACHSFGSIYKDSMIGSHSDFVCFSFQAIKHLTTIDGGALTCRSKDDCERGRLLRWYGIDRNAKGKDLRCEADIAEYGYKFHMNDVTAAIGLEQLKYVDDTLEKHLRNAMRYNKAFKYLKNVQPLRCEDDRLSAYWLYTIRAKNRKRLTEHMKKAGITVSQVHARNDNHTIFKHFKTDLPGVDEFMSEQISIPVGWWLNQTDIEYIISSVRTYDQIAKFDDTL